MKATLLLVLSLSAVALAGPAFNKNNQIETDQQKAQQQHQYMTSADSKQTQAISTLQQWCFASQMSQPELTASFKKLVGIVKSSPKDQTTEAAVMSERICQGAIVQKSAQSGQTVAQNGADAQAHELIKDVYMDSLISCQSRECMQQLLKIINSQKIDTVRASYYMTRIAVTDKDSIKDEVEIKQLAESFLQGPSQSNSEAVERQKLLAVTATLGKTLKQQPQGAKQQQQQGGELRQIAEQVVKTIVERYIKPVSQQEVEQYQQQQQAGQQSSQQAKKIAKRSAALKALANIPGYIIKETGNVEQTLLEIAQNKDELSTARQSAIECLEQNDKVTKPLKQITFDQDEPIEVRVAAYRALMTSMYAGDMKAEQSKQQQASEIVNELIKYAEEQRNQQEDKQFVLYVISHLDNMRSTQQPEYEAIKECIAMNKQHYMQIQVLNKKFKQQLNDVRKSSRNYKLEQEFNQVESGLIIEGDILYESKQKQSQSLEVLPKLIRVNMSMPVMGETVNVVEITVRQNQMDEPLMSALNLVQNAKFNSESVSKVVDSFKQSVEQGQRNKADQSSSRYGSSSYGSQQDDAPEADLTIKIDGCTVVYICADDFKSEGGHQRGAHKRSARSAYGGWAQDDILESLLEHMKRNPVSFNRGFNLNINERLGKLLDVDANIIAGLRFDSRAKGPSSDDFEVVAQIEPRFAFESIVGPAKMSNKKLLQRLSTKTALGLRLRYKKNELVDVQVDLPMNNMELFTVETQIVEQPAGSSSYSYLPTSIYGQEDIYAPDDEYVRARLQGLLDEGDFDANDAYAEAAMKGMRKFKRSVFEKPSTTKSIVKFLQGKKSGPMIAQSFETSERAALITGLRGKLRVVASPKDMSFLVQAGVQKYEPRMQGYRVQVQKVQRGPGSEQKQYVLVMSTPGSRVDRTVQLRVVKQSNSQRTILKSDVQSPKMGANVQLEIVHDSRQYAIKAEIASTRGKQYRHSLEAGIQRGSQSQAGRIASTYKPYLSIDSSSLKRPVQVQAALSYQQSPKTVIIYELKSPNSSNFVQGKIIVDDRQKGFTGSKRGSPQWQSRSMSSPWAMVAYNDVTVTGEFVGQVNEHAVKVHKMIDWDSSKYAVQADLSVAHKNVRKGYESQLSANLKVDQDQQLVTVQRKCPQKESKEFRLTVVSDTKSPVSHQFGAEIRYNGKRASGMNEIAAYKHKIDYSQLSQNKWDAGFQVELIASEHDISEKVTGHTQALLERDQKIVKAGLSSRDKSASFDMDYSSLEQNKLEVSADCSKYQHRTSIRSTPGQVTVSSRTDKKNGQTLSKVNVEVQKQPGNRQCQIIVEMPTKNIHLAADLKGEGKPSSLAVQTPRFASKAEFSFETMYNSAKRSFPGFGRSGVASWMPFATNLRFKSDLKDLMKQQSYWVDSAINGNWAQDKKASFFRANSPSYRADFEFDPRDWNTKMGVFARSKRSIGQFDSLYSNDDSILNKFANKLDLSNKLWAARSVIKGLPSGNSQKVESLKQKALDALFEYADQRQSHKHSFQWSPSEDRFAFNMERFPSGSQLFKPTRFIGDLNTNAYNKRPSAFSMESDLLDFELTGKPFDGEESFAKLSALSRNRRSPFKKHDSEIRYQKDHGYKASMKHQGADDKHHSWALEADQSPKKWAKIQYDSEKHGKGQWEHKWRKEVSKRSNAKRNAYDAYGSDDDIFANDFSLNIDYPRSQWSHKTDLRYEEPASGMWATRQRRDLSGRQSRYSAIDYLKHINGRLSSQTHKNQNELYNVDFDYQPQQSLARLNLNMPDDMFHSSVIEYQPSSSFYKLHSKMGNRRTSQPSYDFMATTKPIMGLGSADQEPFFASEHPMLQTPIGKSLLANVFKQPMKLDYSDKFGRIARFDYDQSPIVGGAFAGLRQKRAAFYYKDDAADFEHQSTYDFYPEAMFGGFKKQTQMHRTPSGGLALKTQTKYGPVMMQVDSDEATAELKLKSPLVNARLTAESAGRRVGGAKLYKLNVDNKQQSVQLQRIVRQTPMLKKSDLAKELAKKFDDSHFEQETELLVSIVDSIFRIKSQTMNNNRQTMTIEGELNEPQQKLVVKVDGKQTEAQLLVDLVTKSASLVLNVDDKRTLQHQTRLVRTSEKFYSLETITSYKQKPLFKLTGKISSMILQDPAHLFDKCGRWGDEHTSIFEATIFKPQPIQVTGQFDCAKKEGRIVFRDLQSKKIQETIVTYDEQSETFVANARLSAPWGQVYTAKAKVNVPGLVQPYNCRTQACQSEIFYRSEQSGKTYAAKLVPGDYIAIDTPHGKQAINWWF